MTPGLFYRVVLLLYFSASVLAFLVFAFDKQAAIHGRRRIPEARLHLLSLLGGWPGAWLAQLLLRHKTQKRRFRVLFLGVVILNCLAVGTIAFFFAKATLA